MPAKAKLTTRERTTSNVSSDNLNKGSELSFAEADSNFINLRDQSFAISDGSTSTDIEAGETITFSGASVSGNTVTVPTGAGITVVGDDSTGTLINGGETLKIAGGTNVTTAMSGDTLTITSSGGGGGSADLGNLQVNDTTLSPVTTNDDLTLTANGTGNVVITGAYNQLGVSGRFGDSSNDGAVLNYAVGKKLTVGSFFGQTGAFHDYRENGLIVTHLADDTKGLYVTTQSDPTGTLAITTPSTGPVISASTFVGSNPPSNQNITITPLGTGYIVLDGLNWPTSDGANGEVLTTDGSGNLSWSAGGGGSSIPSQTGNAGKYLTTDGSSLSWDTISIEGDLTFTGSTISSPSNADLTLDPSGTGDVVLNSDTVKVDNFITSFATSSRLALAPNSADWTDVGTNNEPFLSMTKSTSGGNAQLTVADSKYIYLTTDGYAGGNYGIVLTNSEVKLAPKGTGRINLATATSTTIGSNGSASAPTANPVGYVKVKINGTEYQIPYYNV